MPVLLVRTAAWNEIFDVLLWSVSFATKSFHQKDEKLEEGCFDFSVNARTEYLDTTKAMPQLIRPQDLANVVQSLFHQLPLAESRLSRGDFISKMELFTAGHGFVHNAESANKKILEKIDSIDSNVPRQSDNHLGFRNRPLSFASREFSFSSIHGEENRNTSSIQRTDSNVSNKSLAVAPSSFPINMLLASSESFGGRIRETPVLHHASVEARSKRSQSSDRRVSKEQIGEVIYAEVSIAYRI